MWNKLPLSVKESQSLIEFKSKIKVLKKLTAPAKFAIYNFMVFFLLLIGIHSMQGWTATVWSYNKKKHKKVKAYRKSV